MPGNCVIALKLCDGLPDIEAEYIGADAGALWLAKKGIVLHTEGETQLGESREVREPIRAAATPLSSVETNQPSW